MTSFKISTLAVLLSCFIYACHSSQKAGSQTASSSQSNTSTSTVTAAPNPSLTATPTLTTSAIRNGIIPGELELTAIQLKYPGVTAKTLSNGYDLYVGKCTDCHRKKNIFAYTESKWKDIIDDMAPKSHLTEQETDDLYKYVLSMKATQNAYAK